jgi:membrane protein YdbS with pleckstrin-like domain
MKANETARSGRASLAWSAAFRAVRLLVFGFMGWLWCVSAADSAWKAISFVAVLALAAFVGITWYLSRVRFERRWRAALEAAYAKQEQAKRTYSRRNFHARPQSQDR